MVRGGTTGGWVASNGSGLREYKREAKPPDEFVDKSPERYTIQIGSETGNSRKILAGQMSSQLYSC